MQTQITIKNAAINSADTDDWIARVYGEQEFAGAGKTNTAFLVPLERRMAAWVLPKVPRWLETHHLTMWTPAWSALIVVFSYLAAKDIRWLWMVSLMIVFHYFTDHFDGKLGKYRDTGLRKWGFYMDHFLDYGFLCSVLIGYSFLLPERSLFNIMLVLCVFSAFMFHTFLVLAARDEFKISFLKFGPTEFRIALIIINALLVKFGPRPLKGALKWVALGGLIALIIMIFQTQKQLWRLDMEARDVYD